MASGLVLDLMTKMPFMQSRVFGFRVWVEGSGFSVPDSGMWVLACKVQGCFAFKVQGRLRLRDARLRAWDVEFRVQEPCGR